MTYMTPHKLVENLVWLGMIGVFLGGVIVIVCGFQSDCAHSSWEETCRQTRPPEECVVLCVPYFPMAFFFHVAILLVLESLMLRIGRHLRKQVREASNSLDNQR
jgi:hypothetical protein